MHWCLRWVPMGIPFSPVVPKVLVADYLALPSSLPQLMRVAMSQQVAAEAWESRIRASWISKHSIFGFPRPISCLQLSSSNPSIKNITRSSRRGTGIQNSGVLDLKTLDFWIPATCVTISLVACDDDVHYLTTFSAPPVPMQVTFTRCIGTCVILRLARRSLIYFVCSHVDFSVFPLPGCLSTTWRAILRD